MDFDNELEYHVIKRDNTSEKFQIKKIMLMVEWACDGRNVSPNVLYDRFMLFVVDGMKTSIIQNQLIKVALSLTTPEEPDWADVAGSLLLLNIYKNHREYMKNHNIFGYSKLYDFIIATTNDLLLDQDIVDKFSEKEINEINTCIDIEYDTFDYSGMNLLDKRYLIQYEGRAIEPPQFMYVLTAMVVFKDIADKVRRLKLIKEYYTLMALQIISPATPNLSNLRKYGRGSSPSCFILKLEDDLDSIYDTLHRAAVISKNGGASGVVFSSMRANGSEIKGIKGAAKGVMPFLKLFNDTAVAVDQLGTRVGAITVCLDVWHSDIFSFLDMRKENVDLRVQAQDLFGQIAINDVFLERYNEARKRGDREKDWLLFCPYQFKKITGIKIEDLYGEAFREAYSKAEELFEQGAYLNARKVSTRDLMQRILESDKETGLPYWFNKDFTNECNPNKHEGIIYCSNLCTESFSSFNNEYSHVCNLHSINLANADTEDKIERAARLSVIALNQIVTLSTSPLESTKLHNDRYKIIGIGALGYHDHIVQKGIFYAQSAQYAYELFEKIAYWCIDESVNEVVHIGEYPAFSGSDWEQGIFFGRSVYDEDFSTTPGMGDKWIHLYENKVAKFGMANGGLLAIAPNTGTSQLVNSSASILPVFSKFYSEKNKLMVVPFAAKYLSTDTFWLYQEAINLNPNVVIDVCQNVQCWIDQGISMELVLNTNHYNDASTLRDWYLKAMIGDGHKRSKTVYYLRPIQKGKEEGCTSCAN